MERYDYWGDPDLEMMPGQRNGEYYKVKDVHELIEEILNSNFYKERSYVNVQIPREIWERMQEIVGK